MQVCGRLCKVWNLVWMYLGPSCSSELYGVGEAVLFVRREEMDTNLKL